MWVAAIEPGAIEAASAARRDVAAGPGSVSRRSSA